ncbi:MAG TPA: serine/threonine-protein kinase [Gaiellaceae bacterium]|nr:serine/threonine-protein kinase [Gaiellaceae bacterium]
MEEPVVGGRLGRYVLEERLGHGAMGTVYRAVRDDGLVVALKLAAPELAADETYRRRFERESRIAASLSHPHIVEVIEVGEVDGRPFLASRLVEGRTLAERIAAEGPLAEADLVRVVAEIAAALDVLHERELVHRDVKPANVILEDGGGAMLADFGLARGASDTVLTQTGRVSGTVDYLAPEVIRGAPASPAVDVYALGCVAYECLAGRPPFAARSVPDAILAHLESAPDPLPSPLSQAILQALAKSPDDRPPTATAYALMLRVSLPG